MGEKKLFNRLFEENLLNNRKLVNLNDKIADLENPFSLATFSKAKNCCSVKLICSLFLAVIKIPPTHNQ